METITLLKLQLLQKSAFDIFSYNGIGVEQLVGRLRRRLEHPHKEADKLVSLVVGTLARKSPLPGTYLTNPLVKYDEFGASLPTM